MNVVKVLMGVGAAAGLLSSTVAMAAETRSSTALPSSQSVSTAPVHGVRHATALRGTSSQAETATGTYIVAGLAAAAVIAGIVVVASTSDEPDSNG